MRSAFISARFLALILAGLAMLCGVAPAARAAETLTIYTYESFVADWGPGPKIKAAFEAECGCSIEWVAVADGVALLNRLKLEGRGTRADIVLGLDNNLVAEARGTGLFAPHGVDTTRLSLPMSWTDPLFLPFDYAHFAIIYDSERLKDPPKSLHDLVEGDATEKIILEDPRTSTPGLGFLLWMKAVFHDKAGEAWTKLGRRVLTVTPGWSEAYGLFTKGEAPMVLSYITSPAYHEIEEKSERYKAALFEEGHYIQIEVAGLVAGTAHEALARRFLSFMTGPGFQDQIPTGNWMFPAGRVSSAMPAAFGSVGAPGRTFIFDPEIVAAKRQEWTAEWLDAVTR